MKKFIFITLTAVAALVCSCNVHDPDYIYRSSLTATVDGKEVHYTASSLSKDQSIVSAVSEFKAYLATEGYTEISRLGLYVYENGDRIVSHYKTDDPLFTNMGIQRVNPNPPVLSPKPEASTPDVPRPNPSV